MEADVSKAGDVAEVVDFALTRFGRIDAVVNNAAIGPLGNGARHRRGAVRPHHGGESERTVSDQPRRDPAYDRQGGGSIVNIGSGAGWGKPNMAVYSASKGGVVALSAAMAYDFLHDRIRVNTVIPGGGGIVSGMSLGRVGRR